MEPPETYLDIPGADEHLQKCVELIRLFESGQLTVNEFRASYGLPPLKG